VGATPEHGVDRQLRLDAAAGRQAQARVELAEFDSTRACLGWPPASSGSVFVALPGLRTQSVNAPGCPLVAAGICGCARPPAQQHQPAAASARSVWRQAAMAIGLAVTPAL
jgi:hypothetical protein